MQQGERVTPRIAPSLLPRPCGACVTSGSPDVGHEPSRSPWAGGVGLEAAGGGRASRG